MSVRARFQHLLGMAFFALALWLAVHRLGADGFDGISAITASRVVLRYLVTSGSNEQLIYPFGTCTPTAEREGEGLIVESLSPRILVNVSPYLWGLAAFQASELDRAEQQLAVAARQAARSQLALYALGAVQMTQGDERGAYATWSQAGAARLFLERGQSCVVSGYADLADRYYAAALNVSSPDSPDSVEAYRQLIWYYYYAQAGNYARPDHRESLRQALNAYLAVGSSDTVDYYLTLGAAQLAQNNLADALHSFRVATKLDPNSAETWHWAGLAAYQQQEYEMSRAMWQRVLDIDPNRPEAYRYIGYSYLLEGNHEAALGWFQRGLHVAPYNSKLLAAMVEVYLAQYRYPQALTYALQALAVDHRASFWALAAEAAIGAGDYQQARQFLEEAIALGAGQAQYWERLAQTCVRLGDADCAQAAERKALLLRSRQ